MWIVKACMITRMRRRTERVERFLEIIKKESGESKTGERRREKK